MPRTIRLVAIGLAAIAAFAAALAQPAAEFPGCKWQAAIEAVTSGAIPDVTGCPAKEAMTLVRQGFGNSIDVSLHEDSNATGSRPGTVTRQARAGKQIQLHYAAPPAQPGAAPAAPPPPVIVSPVVAPPAPSPPPPPAVIPAAIPVAVVDPNQPPGAAMQRVSFSISDAAPVEAGQALIFRVSREGDDGRSHQVNLSYGGGGMLVDPPQFLRFELGEPSQKELVVQTAADQPGDGDSTVQVLLRAADDGAFIGAPRLGLGIINDAPPPLPTAIYGIIADGTFSRGNDLRFTVTRTGPLSPAQLAYRIVQEDAVSLIDDTPDRVDFPEGVASVSLIIPADRYAECGGLVVVTLEDGAATSASASFSDPPPDWCDPPPPWWREYLPLIFGGVALGIALLLDKIIKPFVMVHPSCTIEPGTPAFRALEQPVSRWPEVRADVAMEPGELHVTQPLPRSEPPDG